MNIKQTLRPKVVHENGAIYPRAVKAIQCYHYMDDFIDSKDTEEEAMELAEHVRSIHASGKKLGVFQDIWRSGIKWDDQLSEDLLPKWSSWLFNLAKISSIPRWYSTLLGLSKSVQLHTFVDAGEDAYAAVMYES